ncbi:uncharacterized protein LOC129788076 isoform X3 [Lutzomyia longipalpis]|nr:uncharacterized protein LOC129788076 isoform X3 [Lutzomyia longipalpis]XP_055680054.1 uncharacterized protein LOC129788076 isoform X3 [Lutzomyia longipalpis]
MAVCLGPDMEPQLATCGPDKRYCDRKTAFCISEQPDEPECDNLPTLDYSCPDLDGFYPHPTDCSQYFECINQKAFIHNCPPGYAWDTQGMRCKQKRTASDCGVINCKYTDTSVPLSNNATFYGLCHWNNNFDKIAVRQCPGRMIHIANQGCVFVCPSEGVFKDDEDAGYYYECYYYGGKLVHDRKRCVLHRLENRRFDENLQRCV